MIRLSSLIFILTLVISIIEVNCQGCTVNVKTDLHDYAPLILLPNTFEFAYPEKGKSILQIQQGEKLYLSCLGERNQFNISTTIYKDALITCHNNSFIFPDTSLQLPMYKIKCIEHPRSVVKINFFNPKINFPACQSYHAIGFQLPNKFLKVIEMCIDPRLQHPIVSHADVHAYLKGSQRRTNIQIRFNTSLFDSRMDFAYTRYQQSKSFTRLFGANLAQKYITPSCYLQRGHLMARADFYYQSQQVASYYHLNAVPMWSVINGGNWATLEIAVREFSINSGQIFQVWTGSFEVLELEDEWMRPLSIYLMDSTLPVPKFLFKVVYQENTKQAVIFVTLNNPYLITLSDKDKICKDVSDEIKWIEWNRMNPARGLTYACTYHEFKHVFNVIPQLYVNSLLTGI